MFSRPLKLLRRVFSRGGFSGAIRNIGPGISKGRLFLSLGMAFTIALAVFIRIQPLNWGRSLSEFDPYFHYDVTKQIVEKGFSSWTEAEIGRRSWYPFGRDVGRTSFPGLPFTSAVVYFILSGLGFQISVSDACIMFPVLMSVATCIVAYFLGKDVGGKGVGLPSALFLALNPAYIGRTYLGFFDDETVGIFGILLASLLFLRSLRQVERWQVSLGYSLAAGLCLGYVFSSWGASRYPLSLLALFTFILLIAGKYSRRLLTSYSAFMGVGLLIAVSVPKLGLNFLREFECIAAIGVFLILLIIEASQRFKKGRSRTAFVTAFLLAIGLSAVALWQNGFISLPVSKFISVINPLHRTGIPLVESVQEHRPATWATFYYQFGMLIFLAPLGIFFAFHKPTNQKLFMAIYALTTMYFSGSLIRLTIILAPAMCILGALAIVETLRPFTDIATKRSFTRRRLRLHPRVGGAFSIIFTVLLFALIFWPMTRGVETAYTPTTLVSSSIPVRAEVSDWSEALTWMNENLEDDAVVASWWDYGYWITVIGGKITLADNGTMNETQIARIGRMFMSNETRALVELKGARGRPPGYVVVFTTIGQAIGGQSLFGDEVKWRWMAKIGWNSTADAPLEDTNITRQLAGIYSLTTSDQNLLAWYEYFSEYALPKSDRVLTKLMIYGDLSTSMTMQSIYFQIPSAREAIDHLLNVTQPDRFQLLFASSRSMVFVYKVLY